VEFDDYMVWRQKLLQMTLESNSNALYPLLHFVLDDLPTVGDATWRHVLASADICVFLFGGVS
jgi:hypothetical protein